MPTSPENQNNKSKQQKLTHLIGNSIANNMNNNMDIDLPNDLHDPKETKQSNRFKPLQDTSDEDSNDDSNEDFNEDDSSNEDEATIAAKNAPPSLTYHRNDMKLTIKGLTQDHYLDALKQIQIYFTQLQKYDEFAVITPWKESSNSPVITNPNDIPSDEDDAEDYFDGMNPKDKPGTQPVWFKIRLGLSIDLQDIHRSMARFMSRHKWQLKELMLQVERTSCIGMFQYSHGQMDLLNLAESIKNKVQLDVQLRWRIIFTGYRRGTLSDEEKIRAIHVEVDSSKAQEALKTMSQHYGKSKSTLPGGRRMRFFPEYHRVRTIDNQNKILEMKKRQATFLDVIQKAFNNDIHLLDKVQEYDDDATKTKKLLPSLRTMILGMRSYQQGMEHLPLFHSVDKAWAPAGKGDRGHCFLVMPHLQREAEMMMNNLLPYLKFKYQTNAVEKYFTKFCIDNSVGLEWDDEKKCIKSEIEENLRDDAEDDAFIGLSLASKFVKENNKTDEPTSATTTRPEPKASAIFQPKVVDTPVTQETAIAAYYKEDDNSLSTMGFSDTRTIVQSEAVQKPTSTRRTLGNLEGTVVSTTPSTISNKKSTTTQSTPSTIPATDTQTVASSVTMETFFTNFEKQQAQRDQLQQQQYTQNLTMQARMLEILDKLQPDKSPSLEKAGKHS